MTPLKIGIIGATGRVGRHLADEALARQADVRGFVRHIPLSHPHALKLIQSDLFTLTKQDIAGLDVLISAFRTAPGREHDYVTAVEHLVSLVRAEPIRLIIVGGAGSSFTDDQKKTYFYQTPDFPPSIYRISMNVASVAKTLDFTPNINWTMVYPAEYFLPDGDRTGHYRTSAGILIRDQNGRSAISMADYAVAVLDEIEKPQYPNQEMSVAW
jgi:putative NADH-flavin reductase